MTEPSLEIIRERARIRDRVAHLEATRKLRKIGDYAREVSLIDRAEVLAIINDR